MVSWTWRFFSKPKNGVAKCTKCKNLITVADKNGHTTTGATTRHLQMKHNINKENFIDYGNFFWID